MVTVDVILCNALIVFFLAVLVYFTTKIVVIQALILLIHFLCSCLICSVNLCGSVYSY